MSVLVSGGLGFIGSHTCVELLNSGYDVVVVENLYNSKASVKERIEKISGKPITFYQSDMCDYVALQAIFRNEKIEAAIHFAAYKSVGESVEKPLEYYMNNLISTLNLCKVMRENNCFNLIFSSSATVYGKVKAVPIAETAEVGKATNPYGATKIMIEDILADLAKADECWNIIRLRYFNPIGAHKSGLLGESPNDIPNNLMPYICKVANKELTYLHIFGDDYPTSDGTGVRDYIHVVDLAKGHIKAMEKLHNEHLGLETYNLGTGIGYSVLEMVKAFERVNRVDVPYKIEGRRAGDIAECYADTHKANEELGWKAELDLDDMLSASWNFIQVNK